MKKWRISSIAIVIILLIQAGILGNSQLADADNLKKVIILVDPSLLSDIEENLNQYFDDIQMLGYSPVIHSQVWNDPEELRNYLAGQLSEGLVGIVIIGDFPVAWYENETDEFPIDLFYMDLDGIWSDIDSDGYYDGHSGDASPEIWVGRITATTLSGDSVELTNNYLEKLHNLRIGEYTPNGQALLYIDDDWAYMAGTWEDDLSYLYNDNITTINSRTQTNAEDYRDRLNEDFEWIQVAVHSYPTEHWFKVMEVYQADKVTSDDIMQIGPEAFYYNLFACSAARYTETDYIGGCYLFSDSKGVAAIGSTKSGAMKEFYDFYQPLGEGESIGSAFLEWFKIHGENEPDWYYGLTILGDPTLVPTNPLLPEDAQPFIQITEPDGVDDVVDESYTIKWLDSDPDSDSQINLYFDPDNEGFDGILINQQPISEDSDIDEYLWDTKELMESNYYIYAIIDDGVNPPVSIYSNGQVTINHPNILPNVMITSPTGGSVSGVVTIQGTSDDPDGNNIESVYVSIDNMEDWEFASGTTSWSYSWDTTQYSNADHIIYAKAYDGVEYSEIADVTLTVDNIENQAPKVSITYPDDGEDIFGEIEIIGTASDDDGIVELVEIQIDNYGWNHATGISSWSWNWDTTTYTNGKHTIYVRAKDDFGEYSDTESIILYIDNKAENNPPIVNIISPTDETVSGVIIISGTSSDLDGDETITNVQVKINNEDWKYAEGKIHWSYRWDTTTYDDDDYTIQVKAFDGNDYSDIKSVSVFVDNPHTPMLVIYSDIPDEVSGKLTIYGSASDVDGEPEKIEIQVDNGKWEELQGKSDWSYELDTTKLSNGEHSIKIKVTDDEGEINIKTLIIDVKNSQDNLWWLFLLLIIIFIILTITGFALKNRRPKSKITSIGSLYNKEGTQYNLPSLKCPRCSNIFKTYASNSIIQCPHCGISGRVQ